MVHLTSARMGLMKTFGWNSRRRHWNHRVPFKYHRFQDNVDPDEIIAHYSREDIEQLDPRQGQRTYKDAQETLGRRNLLLPNLSKSDLYSNELFQKELDRQRAIIARVNKIKVIVDSVPWKGTELIMNKDISTPFDCAQHLHDLIKSRSVVAQLFPLDEEVSEEKQGQLQENNQEQGEQRQESLEAKKSINSVYWDMHRPLQDNCKIRFRHFTEKDVGEVNKIYWRSCSFVLGMAVRLAFKEEVKVLLHSWPKPEIKSGSFVYDAAINLSETWTPNEQELRALTKIMWEIKNAALPFERLQVDQDVARELFSTNPFKSAQIDLILKNEEGKRKITVYRCGGLLDISCGPMISNTSQIGRISLAAVHPFDSQTDDYKGVFYRFQGASIPQELPISSYLYQNVLITQAKKLNKASL